MKPAQLLLWDIDGTLLTAHGMVRGILESVISDHLGRPYVDDEVELSGRTDHFITRQMLLSNGVPEDQVDRAIPLVLRSFSSAVAQQRHQLAETATLFPGVVPLLHRLSKQPVLHGVVTGNLAVNAVLKLSTFGLDSVIDVEIGGYGSDHEDRNELVAVAMKRLQKKMDVSFGPDEVWIIGDTPHDLEAAVGFGARCLLVATGPYAYEELRGLGADAVFEDLTDADAIEQALGLK